MRRMAVGLTAGILVATLVLAACGSSNKSTTGSSATNSSSGGNGGSSSGGSNQYSQLVTQASKANVKVTYNDSSGKATTYAQDGHGKWSYTSGDSQTIYDGTNTISCSGTGSSASCTQISGGGGLGAGFVQAFTAVFAALANLPSTAVSSTSNSSQTIAGHDANCSTIKSSDFMSAIAGLASAAGKKVSGNASATVCLDKSTGWMLKFSTSDGTTTTDELTATSFGTSSDSDFTPPVTPQTMPTVTLPGGGTIPQYTLPNVSTPTT